MSVARASDWKFSEHDYMPDKTQGASLSLILSHVSIKKVTTGKQN